MVNPVDKLLAAIEAGTAPEAGVFAPDAVLDATVPNWRLSQRGEEAVRGQLGAWFRHPARFEGLRRNPLPGGELVEFTLAWEEGGSPHAAHQAHLLSVEHGRISADTMFCGGRWPASLLAEMAEADRVRA